MNLASDIYHARGPLAGFVAEGLFWGSFAALVPALKPQAALSDSDLGWALLIAAIVAFCAMWVAPKIERLLRDWMMPVLATIMSGGFLLAGFAEGWTAFALAMSVAALGAGTLDIAMNARISVIEGRTNRPLMNFAHGMFSLCYALAAIGAGLAREAGFAPLHVFIVITTVVLVLSTIMRMAPVSDTTDDATAAGSASLSWIFLLPVGAVVLVGFMAEQATEGWSALHLERRYGAGAAEGALGPALLGLTMALGRFSGQAVAHRASELVILSIAATLSASGALIAAWGGGLWAGYLGFALLGLGVSVVAPMAFAWIGKRTPTGHKAQAISRVAMLGYSGFFVGPPIMGFLAQGYGLSVAFTAMAMALLAIPLALVPVSRVVMRTP